MTDSSTDARDSSRVTFPRGTGTGIGAAGLMPMSGAVPMQRVNRTEGNDTLGLQK